MALEHDEDGDLPEGAHELSFEEFRARFAYNARRRALLAGFEWALGVLKRAGVRRVTVGGSFVTNREVPGDIDACWDLDPDVRVARIPEGFPERGGQRDSAFTSFRTCLNCVAGATGCPGSAGAQSGWASSC